MLLTLVPINLLLQWDKATEVWSKLLLSWF